MTTLNLTTLKADDARVEVSFTVGNGEVIKGSIENSFFQEFISAPNQQLSPARRQRIVAENAAWLTAEADRQLRMGHTQITIA